MTAIITSPETVQETGPAAPAPGRPWRGLLRQPLGLLSAGYLLLLVVVAAAGTLLTPRDPEADDLAHTLSGPSGAHWLGTDRLGRDVFSRLMVGSRPTLLGVAEAVLVFVVLGVALGMVAGFAGGRTDRLIARLGDLVLAVPGIIALLMVLAVFPDNNAAAMIAFGLISSPSLLRVVRAVTMAVRNELYVKAARLSGLSTPAILRRHILPRLAGPVIVQVSLFAASAVLAETALSFLGLATPETQGPSWGNMVGEAASVISVDPWLLVPTGGMLVVTVLALGLLGDTVHDLTVGRARGSAVRPVRRPRPAVRTAVAVAAADVAAAVADGAPTEQGAAAPLLSVRGLTIAFPSPEGEVTVVRGVGFDVARGECVGIVGESGCGKTVTARSLVGLLPGGGRVVAGSVAFDGRDLADPAGREVARLRGSRIGLISQEPMSGLDPSFRVGSQLAEVVRRHHRLTRRQSRARALELLALVELPDPASVARSHPHELSGGMAQRVSIALALAGEPDLLIADEPTTALDVTVQAEILNLLRSLRVRTGMAVVLVTHDWGVLADLCERAVVMYAGEVVEQAPVSDLYHAPRHPYTLALLAANPHLAAVGQELPAIPGTVPPPSAWPAGCHFQPRCGYATEECGAGAIPLVTVAGGHQARCIHVDRLEAAR
ncbi:MULTISPECIES: dipeptide/oligopeptide/nickel ABC transporter permease/ATP-binding protein [Streptacidiphilus]|uniref:Dipeptide/oligopeptide/nickel ABC transporter permease/ATP-binding protein n=1 Tax=Streptacidiphilus cavernicola TaxID=3342716 RepID=A0ABV6UJ76_9ACTN|nr:dipeptide/oligopeptide/nickel ABC transporter permease/ATP-binding protein [Streptacidiphilus jeojiense]